jgi:hypothetical protein
MTGIDHGRYVDLEKRDGDLHVVLNDAGRRVFAQIQAFRDRLGSVAAMRRLLRDHFEGRWTEILPEEIAALTAATIISDEAKRDQSGRLIALGRVYWHERYQIEDPIAAMREHGFVRFDGAMDDGS